VNILDRSLLKNFQTILQYADDLIKEKRIRVLVIYSLKKDFMVGYDLKRIYRLQTSDDAIRFSNHLHSLMFRLENLSIPTVAAVHGACKGVGLEVALSCSYRVSSDHRLTLFELPEVKLGLIPCAGATIRLPRIIGLSEALQLILTGKSINATKARQLGLVDEIFGFNESETKFFNKVREYAFKLANNQFQIIDKYSRNPTSIKNVLLEENVLGRSILEYKAKKHLNAITKGRYHAPYVALETVMRAYSISNLEEAAKIEMKNFAKLACTKQAKNLISLFQMVQFTKKIANFVNPAKAVPITRVGIVGSGSICCAIAQSVALKNFKIYIKCIDEEYVQKDMKQIEILFGSLVARGKMSKEDLAKYIANITADTTYYQLANVQIIIETVIEREEAKQEILRNIEALNPNIIFATNTFSIPVTKIASIAKRKENILGMHFTNLIQNSPLVEIVRTKYTSESAIATVYKFALDIGKLPIIVNDGPGFLTTRLFSIYILEATRLVLEGIPIDQVDIYLQEFGFPIGPFRIMDECGLDIGLTILSVLSEKLDIDVRQYSALHELVKTEKSIGRKVRKGFYIYDDQNKAIGVNPSAIRILHKHHGGNDGIVLKDKLETSHQMQSHKSSSKEMNQNMKLVIDRCILILINEATKCMEERIVNTPEDLDLAMVLGFGFPPFRGGGLLGYCDQLGLTNVVKKLEALSQRFGTRFQPTKLLTRMSKNKQRFFPERRDPPSFQKSNI
jgi:3-hydroxyacyl-CoA dehydrogenase/enoyl-CoA hydratase/3-hydroxybutyryl-CoA epimerase